MTYLPLKEEEKQRKTYQQIIEEKNNMKTMIHSENYIILSKIEGIKEKTLEFFNQEDTFVLNVKDQDGTTQQSFFEKESLEAFVNGDVSSAFEDFEIEVQEALKEILEFCKDNNIQKVWF